MSATTVPVILLGRYSTLAGTEEFATSPIVVAEYSSIELALWRGPMADASWQFLFKVQESMDRQTWKTIASSSPSANLETRVTADLSRTWLRATVELSVPSGFPVASCYAVGFLVSRRP